MKQKSPEINRGFYGFDYSINIFDLLILIDLVNDTIWLAQKHHILTLLTIYVDLGILYRIIKINYCVINV